MVCAVLAIGTGNASAADVQHGIGLTKGCTSPTKVGDPYTCTFTVRNNLDEAHDTLTISQLTDTVHSAGGNVSFSTVLDSAPAVASAGATCTAPPNRTCTLPFGGRVDIGPFTHYTVTPADFASANPLTDDASLKWNDTCDNSPQPSDCNPSPPNDGAASQAVLIKRASQTATQIHDAGHQTVTVVEAGATVHDFVSVTTSDPSPTQATPSGNVTIDFFTNNQCTGTPDSTSAPIALGANGTVDATGFAKGPLAPGLYGFLAHYAGDGTYNSSDGSCEPLRVVDANIQITPAAAVNPVNTNHTLTCHINVNDGNGFTNAPNGTVCTVAIVSGPGTPASQNCSTVGTTGDCQVTITSSAVGQTTIRASTDVDVAGVALHRQTGDAHAGDSADAQKTWVDANIQITPATATNPINSDHVLTITVNALGGTIDAGSHTATASIVSGPGSFVGSPTCTYTGGGATASCTVTITSGTAGTTVVQATSDIPVSGVVITRTTGTAANTASGGSGNAQKLWLQPDANIQITPATAVNPINTNHTLHCHINVSPDSSNYSNAPDGTICTVNIISGPGTPATQNCTTSGGTGTCDVVITSSTVGTSVVQATTIVTVTGVTLTRTTGDQNVGDGPNAQKTWVDANIAITPATASNPVGTNHVLTITVHAIGGTIDAGPHTATASIVSGPGSFVGSPTCTYTGGATTASCTVTITSSSVGTTVVSATSNVPVNGVTITRTTGTAVNTASGGSGNASKNWGDATASTSILNASGTVITTAQAGTVVHDRVFVARGASTPASVPNPTGTVIFHRYSTINCTGTSTDQSVALTPGAPSTADSDTFAVTADMSYQAAYQGDANYPARTGACEPLTVTPVPQPAIAIVKNPKSQAFLISPGQPLPTAKFKITVTNTGNTVLTNVTVTDPLSPNCNRTSAQIPALASMAPGASVTYSCQRPNVSSSFTNVATATGTPPSGPNVTATDTAPVTVRRPILPPKKHPKVVSHKRPKATG